MPHIAISMYPGRSREEKAALAEKVRTLVSEELKKDPKVVTVSVHDVPAEKWQEHLDTIPGEERFYKKSKSGLQKEAKDHQTMDDIPMDNIAQAVSKK